MPKEGPKRILPGESLEDYHKRLRKEKNARFRKAHPNYDIDRFMRLYWENDGDNDFKRAMSQRDKDRRAKQTPEEREAELRAMRRRSKRYTARRRADRRRLAARASGQSRGINVGIEDDDISLTLGEFMEVRYG